MTCTITLRGVSRLRTGEDCRDCHVDKTQKIITHTILSHDCAQSALLLTVASYIFGTSSGSHAAILRRDR